MSRKSQWNDINLSDLRYLDCMFLLKVHISRQTSSCLGRWSNTWKVAKSAVLRMRNEFKEWMRMKCSISIAKEFLSSCQHRKNASVYSGIRLKIDTWAALDFVITSHLISVAQGILFIEYYLQYHCFFLKAMVEFRQYCILFHKFLVQISVLKPGSMSFIVIFLSPWNRSPDIIRN